ncbi:PhoX family phosphatase [Chloroflexia bacterium SDU3-3]|nr:PhoX family phosphatase [Chloroflexia bacterium SDU3-3]
MGGRDEVDKWVIRSNDGAGETFQHIVERKLSRRSFLKGAALSSAALIAGITAPELAEIEAAQRGGLQFAAVKPTDPKLDEVRVPEGYYARTLIRWGEPLTADAPNHDVYHQTPAAQAKQFGYNCDFVGFLPLPLGSKSSDRGVLVVNHEYTNEELMFPAYDPKKPTRAHVDVCVQAHGMSVVEIQRAADGSWMPSRSSSYNRRVTGDTPHRVSGPAAGHAWLRTSADPEGTTVLGTLNNCAGGKTPWGTVLSGEENFHQYFGNLGALPKDDPRAAAHQRYGLPTGSSERSWEAFYDRFDLAKEPNEAFRFGWVVEIDPYDPTMTPIKRTALGRFRHEGATIEIAPSGQVVAYMGDDAQFEYVYKFVSRGRYNPNDRAANMGLLDDGTLYVAKFNDDGSGQWLPLVYGQGPLTEANGFGSQGDVLVKTRQAADALGATKMDRPEDVEGNPANRKIYVVCTNNTARATEGKPGTDTANPRAKNETGHVIEITEAKNDHASTSFSWDIFLLAGRPEDPSTYFAGFDKSKVSPIGAVDNIAFDLAGNAWIATDGAPRAIKLNDGLFAVPVQGAERGHVQQFFSTVTGSEVCGPEFSPDNRTLFLAIQHPGEGGTFENPISTWPDRVGLPRPSVIYIGAWDGRVIGR